MVELAIGIPTMVILLVGLGLTLNKLARFNHNQLTRQRCIAAAQATLDSIGATGREIPDDELKRLWPKVDISVRQSPGKGQWKGLKLVQVTAIAKSYSLDVKIQMARYVNENRFMITKAQ